MLVASVELASETLGGETDVVDSGGLDVPQLITAVRSNDKAALREHPLLRIVGCYDGQIADSPGFIDPQTFQLGVPVLYPWYTLTQP